MNSEDIVNSNDYELIMLYRENDEQAKNILYLKYKYIINMLIKKYSKYLIMGNVDYQDVYSDCSVAFSDALKNYQEEKDTTLVTFITLCIERKLHTIIRKINREKFKIDKEAYSLDFLYENNQNLANFIADLNYEPLTNMTDYEKYIDLINKIKEELSPKEYDVFVLMLENMNYLEIADELNLTPKQVDNTMQRLKTKIKNILDLVTN